METTSCSVLFVCAGNICRSPMAEGVFQKLVNEAGLSDQISVDSAGTTSYHVGDRAHIDTQRMLEKNGISYDGRARVLTRADLQAFDYILAMDNDNLADIRSMGKSTATVARLLDYAPELSTREVPDPYYNGGFEHVYDLVLGGSKGLLAQIRLEKDL
ncbi:MAG: low molecular weight protein-tyrosine-phosphatase [Chloroflexota bacterium]